MRERIKTLLIYILCAAVLIVVAQVIGMYVPVLICDVLRLGWGICR